MFNHYDILLNTNEVYTIPLTVKEHKELLETKLNRRILDKKSIIFELNMAIRQAMRLNLDTFYVSINVNVYNKELYQLLNKVIKEFSKLYEIEIYSLVNKGMVIPKEVFNVPTRSIIFTHYINKNPKYTKLYKPSNKEEVQYIVLKMEPVK